ARDPRKIRRTRRGESPQLSRGVAGDGDQIAGHRRRFNAAWPVDAVRVDHAVHHSAVGEQSAELPTRLELDLVDRLSRARIEHVKEAALLAGTDDESPIAQSIELRRVAEIEVGVLRGEWKPDRPRVIGRALIHPPDGTGPAVERDDPVAGAG